jgi:hypothetical protein
MLKRFLLLAGLLSLGSPAFAAGTIPFSLSQQFDSLGKCRWLTANSTPSRRARPARRRMLTRIAR